MDFETEDRYTAFFGGLKIAMGTKQEMTALLSKNAIGHTLIFNDRTGEQTDLGEVVQRRGRRGRPKLGVISKEVTLLPSQWRWLAKQPNGASETIRKLVEKAMKEDGKIVEAQEACYKVMLALCGNRQGYEEALRALYSNDEERFRENIKDWPKDIGEYIVKLARGVFDE